ncbi:hypothetical protein MiYa_03468 [Microcystis aeruginosa NIES-2519]|uniref:Uncharacterized protein n=1 Tax=Microcystis aeruginosa NIES-2519 TaxID=2303981 RepID=A0A5A5RFQ5_MICAE|nr:hypothetical protein MiYa_03468 [Microcystis aeruginosa NIES-2519]GCA89196.1 hypothetical protein MiTa_02546 [Microcystis aeruginosa NIES-4264]
MCSIALINKNHLLTTDSSKSQLYTSPLIPFSLFVADILLPSPRTGEGLGVRVITIPNVTVTLEKWYKITAIIWSSYSLV